MNISWELQEMDSVPGFSMCIQQEIALGKSYMQLAEELQPKYPGKRGGSVLGVSATFASTMHFPNITTVWSPAEQGCSH